MKTALVTGANRGIGLALVRRLRGRGEDVIAVCRRRSPELEATGSRIVDGVDVAEPEALQALAAQLGEVRIDTLILNAGILRHETLGGIDAAGITAIREQFAVNSLGPLLTAQALLDHLASDAKIGIVTSRMGSIADNGSGGYYGYRASKAAVNAIGRSLAMDLKPRGIAVTLLHPGFVQTEMVGGQGEVTPDQAAEGLIARLDALSLETTGGFWHANGQPLPW